MIYSGNRPTGEAERELAKLKLEAVKYVIVRNAIDGNTPLDEIPFT